MFFFFLAKSYNNLIFWTFQFPGRDAQETHHEIPALVRLELWLGLATHQQHWINRENFNVYAETVWVFVLAISTWTKQCILLEVWERASVIIKIQSGDFHKGIQRQQGVFQQKRKDFCQSSRLSVSGDGLERCAGQGMSGVWIIVIIVLANHKRHRQSCEPIKARRNYT